MNILSLVLLALETIAQVASNPALGLGGDGARIAGLINLVAKLGRQGNAAAEELKAFTAEIQALADAGGLVDPETWDALTKKRHNQADEIAALGSDD